MIFFPTALTGAIDAFPSLRVRGMTSCIDAGPPHVLVLLPLLSQSVQKKASEVRGSEATASQAGGLLRSAVEFGSTGREAIFCLPGNFLIRRRSQGFWKGSIVSTSASDAVKELLELLQRATLSIMPLCS